MSSGPAGVLGVPGSPRALWAAAEEFRDVKNAFVEVQESLRAHRTEVLANWHGDAADTAYNPLTKLWHAAETAALIAEKAMNALHDYADELNRLTSEDLFTPEMVAADRANGGELIAAAFARFHQINDAAADLIEGLTADLAAVSPANQGSYVPDVHGQAYNKFGAAMEVAWDAGPGLFGSLIGMVPYHPFQPHADVIEDAKARLQESYGADVDGEAYQDAKNVTERVAPWVGPPAGIVGRGAVKRILREGTEGAEEQARKEAADELEARSPAAGTADELPARTTADDAADSPSPGGATLSPVTLHEGRQGKHVPGHPNYEEGKSQLTVDANELLLRAGEGTPVNKVPVGEAGYRERIDFGREIGNYKDKRENLSVPTTTGILHYGRDGVVHIVPARPSS